MTQEKSMHRKVCLKCGQGSDAVDTDHCPFCDKEKPPQESEGWTERFDEKYLPKDNGDGTFHRNEFCFPSGSFAKNVKAFIRSEISKAMERERREVKNIFERFRGQMSTSSMEEEYIEALDSLELQDKSNKKQQ